MALTSSRGDYHHFHYLTRVQYDYLSGQELLDTDDLYFISDENVFYKGAVRMSDPVALVAEFPATGAQGRIYVNTTTLEAKVYIGSAWTTIAYGKVTSITSESTNTTVPTAQAVYDFVTTAISNAELGSSGIIHPPVADIMGLEMLPDYSDRMLCLVESTGALYRYDAQSTDELDPPRVLAPDSVMAGAPGRWIMLLSSIAINADDFEWDESGQLTLKALSSNKISDLTATIRSMTVERFDTMPAVNSTDNGRTAIYTGTTGATYTQGHIYKVVTGAWADITPESGTLDFSEESSDGDILVYRTVGGVVQENLDTKLAAKAEFNPAGDEGDILILNGSGQVVQTPLASALPADVVRLDPSTSNPGDIVIVEDDGGTKVLGKENLYDLLKWNTYEGP